MTSTTCTHPCPSANTKRPRLRWPAFSLWRGLASLGAWVSKLVQTRYTYWSDNQALQNMDLHQLKDVGAPDWMLQRAAVREAQQYYEYTKDTSRLKY